MPQKLPQIYVVISYICSIHLRYYMKHVVYQYLNYIAFYTE